MNEQKFRKKPVVIEAVQYTGEAGVVLEFATAGERNDVETFGFKPSQNPLERRALIKTLEGTMEARPGDWIIRGVKGEYYPCKPDIFAATYESADSPVASTPSAAYIAAAKGLAENVKAFLGTNGGDVDALSMALALFAQQGGG